MKNQPKQMTLFLIILKWVCIFLLCLIINWELRRVDGLEKQIKKLNADINSLHQNQRVLVSNLKVIHNDVRKHDKRKLKLRFGGEKTGSEESSQGRSDSETVGSV